MGEVGYRAVFDLSMVTIGFTKEDTSVGNFSLFGLCEDFCDIYDFIFIIV